MNGLLGPDADSLQILSAWRAWLTASYAPNTVEGYWGHAFRFMRAHPMPLTMVSEQDVAAWLESYPYRAQSRRDGHQALKSLFNWMEGHRLIVLNPVTGIRVPPINEKEPQALTESEFRAVYEAAFRAAPYRAHTLAVLYYTGARLNELVNLKWDDVKSDHLVLRATKNGKERKVPLTIMLNEALYGLAEHFSNSKNVVPRSGQTIWLWCRQAGKEAGVRCHPHLFRATMVSDMLNAGVPIQVVAKAAGHSSTKVTHKHYAASRPEQLGDAFEKLQKLVHLPEASIVSVGGMFGAVVLELLRSASV